MGIDIAIKSAKKKKNYCDGHLDNIIDFPTFVEKIINGSTIGTRKEMTDLIKQASQSSLKVVIKEAYLRRPRRF